MAEVICRCEVTIRIDTLRDKFITTVMRLQGETREDFAKRVVLRTIEATIEAADET